MCRIYLLMVDKVKAEEFKISIKVDLIDLL